MRLLKHFVWIVCLMTGITTLQAQTTKKTVAKKTTVPAKKSSKPKKVTHTGVAVQPTEIPGVRVKLTTNFGDMVLRLSDKTPQHRDNFIKLVETHFYDSLLFHRVINGFMIQGGDPQSKGAPQGMPLGMGSNGYTIPAEFDSSLYHKKGALCAARTNNPEKASSGCQFYIVQGKQLGDNELNMYEQGKNIRYSPTQRMTYKMNGGTPFLDRDYTVFGELESGMDVLDKIATTPTDGMNRPTEDVMIIKAEIINKK